MFNKFTHSNWCSNFYLNVCLGIHKVCLWWRQLCCTCLRLLQSVHPCSARSHLRISLLTRICLWPTCCPLQWSGCCLNRNPCWMDTHWRPCRLFRQVEESPLWHSWKCSSLWSWCHWIRSGLCRMPQSFCRCRGRCNGRGGLGCGR